MSTGPRRVKVEGDRFHPRVPDGAVYVGRAGPHLKASPYANPYTVKEYGRDRALELYRQHLRDCPELVDRARRELAGHDLACWCRPGEACHAARGGPRGGAVSHIRTIKTKTGRVRQQAVWRDPQGKWRAKSFKLKREATAHLEQVAAELAAFQPRPYTEREMRVHHTPRTDSRDVYFVQAGPAGLIKIGVSADVERRLAGLRTHSPVPLSLLGVWPSAGKSGEQQLHARFAAHRLHGEWFQPSPDLLAHIAEVASGDPLSGPQSGELPPPKGTGTPVDWRARIDRQRQRRQVERQAQVDAATPGPDRPPFVTVACDHGNPNRHNPDQPMPTAPSLPGPPDGPSTVDRP
jgi:hypothetical protein